MAYDEIMVRLKGQKPGFRDAAMKVLTWIVHAQRPLKVSELQHAIAIDCEEEEEDAVIDGDSIPDIEDLISCCCGLLVVDQQSQIVRLVHYTAQEYFDARQSSYFPEAQARIAAACISYLRFQVLSDFGACREGASKRMRSHPLLQYAVVNWGNHAQSVQTAVLEQVKSLLLKDSDLGFISQMMPVLFMQTELQPYSSYFTYPWTAMDICAWFGLDLIFEDLLDTQDYLDNPNMACSPSTLHLAAHKGHATILTLLLRRGADMENPDDWGYTPICYAALGHRLECYNLLANHGANVFPNYRISRLMLDRILESKDIKMIEALLDSGNDTSIKERSKYGYSASFFGVKPIENCPELVLLLLRRGYGLGLTMQRREMAMKNPESVILVRRRQWVATFEGEPLYPDEEAVCHIKSISVAEDSASGVADGQSVVEFAGAV